MKRIATILNSIVTNISVWDGVTPWNADGQHVDVTSLTCTDNSPIQIGCGYNGTSFTAVAPVPVIIPDVTPRQIRLALIQSGVVLSSIDATIAAMPQPSQSLAQITWEYSTAFERSNPLVAEIGAMMGWTSAQLDALWHLAGTL